MTIFFVKSLINVTGNGIGMKLNDRPLNRSVYCYPVKGAPLSNSIDFAYVIVDRQSFHSSDVMTFVHLHRAYSVYIFSLPAIGLLQEHFPHLGY